MKDSFAEQYKHPKWQKKRLEILERDGYACNWCGETETELQIHHIEYTRGKKVWEYEDDNFLTLCKQCHEDVTDVLLDIRRKLWNEEYLIVLKHLAIIWTDADCRKHISGFMQGMAEAIKEIQKCHKDS